MFHFRLPLHAHSALLPHVFLIGELLAPTFAEVCAAGDGKARDQNKCERSEGSFQHVPR